MTTLNTTPILDLETAISTIGSLASAVAEAYSYAQHAEPGSRHRADHASAALASLEELESAIRDARTGIEALP